MSASGKATSWTKQAGRSGLGPQLLDNCVGLSHTTGQITHHISAAIDPERDKIIDDIRAAGDLPEVYWVDDFQEPSHGKNGGGDRLAHRRPPGGRRA